MSDLMCKSDVGDCGWNVFAVVQQCDDPGVQALHASAVMLKKQNSIVNAGVL